MGGALSGPACVGTHSARVHAAPACWAWAAAASAHPHQRLPGLPQDEVFLNGAIVLPHKDIKESILEEGKIVM